MRWSSRVSAATAAMSCCDAIVRRRSSRRRAVSVAGPQTTRRPKAPHVEPHLRVHPPDHIRAAEAVPGRRARRRFPGARPRTAGLERADAAAISWDAPPIDDILAAAPRLRWLNQRGAGIDRIATPRLV